MMFITAGNFNEAKFYAKDEPFTYVNSLRQLLGVPYDLRVLNVVGTWASHQDTRSCVFEAEDHGWQIVYGDS